MATVRNYGALALAAVGVVAVLTAGAWRWIAFALFVVLLAVILTARFADGQAHRSSP